MRVGGFSLKTPEPQAPVYGTASSNADLSITSSSDTWINHSAVSALPGIRDDQPQ